MQKKSYHNTTDLEIARIGFTDDEYEIYVVTDDDGKIPHFHYLTNDGLIKFYSCIKIENAEYFHHDNAQNILSHEQKINLIAFLNKRCIRNMSNWEVLLDCWNMNNSEIQVSDSLAMPDYMNLK